METHFPSFIMIAFGVHRLHQATPISYSIYMKILYDSKRQNEISDLLTNCKNLVKQLTLPCSRLTERLKL